MLSLPNKFYRAIVCAQNSQKSVLPFDLPFANKLIYFWGDWDDGVQLGLCFSEA